MDYNELRKKSDIKTYLGYSILKYDKAEFEKALTRCEISINLDTSIVPSGYLFYHIETTPLNFLRLGQFYQAYMLNSLKK